MNNTEKPTHDEFEESKLPEKVAIAYPVMYAHGMYSRIKLAEDDKVPCDSGVVAIIWRRNRGRRVDRAWELENREFVRWIKEILKLDYRNHYYIVFICSWIPTNMSGPNAKVVCDDYRFILGNFSQTMPLGPDSFIFPTQYILIFHSDAGFFFRLHAAKKHQNVFVCVKPLEKNKEKMRSCSQGSFHVQILRAREVLHFYWLMACIASNLSAKRQVI